jgi:hypothetical protein
MHNYVVSLHLTSIVFRARARLVHLYETLGLYLGSFQISVLPTHYVPCRLWYVAAHEANKL